MIVRRLAMMASDLPAAGAMGLRAVEAMARRRDVKAHRPRVLVEAKGLRRRTLVWAVAEPWSTCAKSIRKWQH
jgi:hypothetical protein